MRLFHYIPLVPCISSCLAMAEFINPPAEDDKTDSSLNAVYAKGATINIQWTPVDQILAITLFQLNKTNPKQFLPGLEYIATSLAPNATSFVWTVQTKKSLEESPLFYMNLFVTGATTGTANSHAFNISLPGGVQPQSSSSSSIITSTSSLVSAKESPTSSTVMTPSAPLAPSSATSEKTSVVPTQIPSPSGLSSEAKAGIGIGVSAAVIFGFAAGWFLFGRKKVGEKLDGTPTAPPQYYYEPKHESTPKIPQELSQESAPGVPTTYERYELPEQR